MVSYSVRNIIIGYAIAIAAVLMILGFAFYNLRSPEKELVKIKKAREVLQKLEPGLIDIQEFESDLDKLLFFGKEKYLNSYIEGLKKLRDDSLLLAQLRSTYPEMSNESLRLTGLIHEMTSFSALVIQSPETKNPDTTGSKWQKNAGNRIVTDFKTTVGKMEEENRKNLSKSYDLTINLTKRILTFVTIISGALILALLISFRVSYLDIRSRLNYNRDLVKQVDEKTAEIKKSEERYRSLIEQASDFIMITDPQGNFSDVNSSLCKMFGYSKEELLQSNISVLIEPEQLKAEPIRFDWLLQGKGILRELKMMHKNGTITEVEANIKMLLDGRILAIARDITERKQAEEALINNELRFRTLTVNAPAGIFQTDAVGKTTYVNETWLGYTGMTFDEALGDGWVEAVHPDDRLGLATQWYERSEKGLESSSEYRLVDKKGNTRWVSGKAVPIFTKDGEITGHMGTLSDITERKKGEEELAKSYKSIRQLTDHLQNIREEERTHIAREIHDELGQQLTVLKMDISWLSKKISLDDDTVHQKMNGLREMLDSTMKTVRKIASELRPSLLDDLGLVAAMEWHLKEFESRSGIKTKFLETEATEPAVPLTIKTGLYRIFQESLTNVARHAGAKKVCISLMQNEGVIVLNIEDDGIGFDAKKAATQKTLGILGMKERTLVMGGSYTIKSKPGKGTMVEVSVPVNQQ
jgi:PAS domain S-box-containing protein